MLDQIGRRREARSLAHFHVIRWHRGELQIPGGAAPRRGSRSSNRPPQYCHHAADRACAVHGEAGQRQTLL